MNSRVRDYLMQVYLYKMLQDFEQKWRCNPSPVPLPAPCQSIAELRMFVSDFVDTIIAGPDGN